VTVPLRLRIGLGKLLLQVLQVYSKSCHTLVLLLASFFVIAADFEAPVHRIHNAVVNEVLEVPVEGIARWWSVLVSEGL
jgi:hypothetical protein